jgi:hypothetical protein
MRAGSDRNTNEGSTHGVDRRRVFGVAKPVANISDCDLDPDAGSDVKKLGI